jgi:vanillate O-demethylase ferredoxin subunit
VPFSCSQGICGTCLTPVLAGQPDHWDMYLTPEEQAKGDCIMVCCSRSQTARLVLDL